MSTATTQEREERRERPVVDTLRTLFLASIGALALTRDEIEQMVRRLVERGELAEKDARKLLDEVLAARKEGLDRWGARIEERVEHVLERLRIPRQQDLEGLEARLSALEAKIDALMAQLEERSEAEE